MGTELTNYTINNPTLNVMQSKYKIILIIYIFLYLY